MSPPIIIAISGSTGTLGQLLAKHLFEMKANDNGKPIVVRALVREGSLEKDEAKYLKDNGAEIVVGDMTDEMALAKLVDGAHTLVSTAQGGPDIIIDAQTKALEACKKAGVKRFVPTDFSFNHFALSQGDNINSDWRRAFAQKAAEIRGKVQVVHVLNGCFMDKQVLFGFLGAISLETSKINVWGDLNSSQKIRFTSFSDTAKFTAAMAVDETDKVPTTFNIAGDSLTISEVKQAVESATGKKLEVVNKGSLEDLSTSISTAQREDPSNFFGYLPGMYYRAMLSGTGDYEPTGNELYPYIKPDSLESFVKKNLV